MEFDHLSPDIREEPSQGRHEDEHDFNRRLLQDALKRAGGVRKKAAQILGVGRSTFYRRLGTATSKDRRLD